ncbi:MAG TPA: SH3 domain-containing protein, partial [Elusimicrobiales bacterium]|nr:SH3 domain-containing protein [Elusimicrobiales bacterium]
HYWRAFQLQPRDPDIRANLSFAMKKAGNELVPAGMPEVLHSFYNYLSMKELRGLFLLFCWAALLPGAVYAWPSRRRNWLFRWILVCGILAAACGLWLLARKTTGWRNPAVVIQNQAEVRTGPGDNFTAVANVPEGHTVEVMESKEDWLLVGIRRENVKGWIIAGALERI